MENKEHPQEVRDGIEFVLAVDGIEDLDKIWPPSELSLSIFHKDQRDKKSGYSWTTNKNSLIIKVIYDHEIEKPRGGQFFWFINTDLESAIWTMFIMPKEMEKSSDYMLFRLSSMYRGTF